MKVVTKLVTKYVCEICGGTYEKEEDAWKCEAKHKNGTIANMRFVPGNRFPSKIDVRFDGGEVVTYFCEGSKHDSD